MKRIVTAITASAIVALAATTVGLAALPQSAPVFHVPLGVNLIQNPGAERGVGSTTWNDEPWIPDWQAAPAAANKGYITVATYKNTSGYQPPLGAKNRGNQFFAGGPNNGGTAAYQNIDTFGLDKVVDRGKLHFALSGWFGGYADQDDYSSLKMSFLERGGDRLAEDAETPPVVASTRHYETKLLYRKVTGVVPPGTRMLEITLAMGTSQGPYDDGYADNLSLVLTKSK